MIIPKIYNRYVKPRLRGNTSLIEMALTLDSCLDLIPNEFRQRLHHKLEEGGSLVKIARSIRDWKIAAYFLPGIEDQDVAAIEHDQSLSLDLQK